MYKDAQVVLSSLQILRSRASDVSVSKPDTSEVLLISSRGFGVVDSGCGRTIIGRNTLTELEQLLRKRGMASPEVFHETNCFKYGNGQKELTDTAVRLPVKVAGRPGTIKAAVVRGDAPLLISRSALQALNAVLDFGNSRMLLFEDQIPVPLTTNEAGQFVINVLDGTQASKAPEFVEEMSTEAGSQHVDPVKPCESSSPSPSEPAESLTHAEASPPGPSESLQVWSRSDSSLLTAPTTGKQGPSWQQVRRRRIINVDTNDVIFDGKHKYHHDIPKNVMNTITEYHFVPQEKTISCECLPVHCIRQLESQVRKPVDGPQSTISGKPFLVAEVFCPPRFAPLIHGMNGVCKSFDKVTGYDFSKASTRDAVAEELRKCPPDLLVLSPPCTHEGGWFNLNACTMDPLEYARKVRLSRIYIRFCCKLFAQQVALGGQAVLEHPLGSRLWTYAEVQELLEEHDWVKCHMCRYGLRIPKSDQYIRKATKLLISHAHMKSLGKECPGSEHPKHKCHQVVAGIHPEVGQVSTFAGKYTPQFVEAIMDTVPRYVTLKKQLLVPCPEWPSKHVQEVLAARVELAETKSDEELLKVIDKLHRNLGHPPNHDLVRILKHGQASEKAMELARKFTCNFCQSRVKPHVPLPAKSSRPQEFNQSLGIDVKYLNGWKPGQTIKAVNMVDQASCYQVMVPFYQTETSRLLRDIVAEHWIKVFGPPKEVLLDAAPTNQGKDLQDYLESPGCHVHVIAGEAHWQLGRTENHGGWFGRVLDRTVAEMVPTNQQDWESCVTHAHVKNTMIQSYGYTPHQYVFGRNPDVPTDLMSEPLHVVPATAGLSQDAVAKSQEIRKAARTAVIQTQDDTAIRRALAARPRVPFDFMSGDLVAYWRVQKYQPGGVVQQGQWYGTAVVVGNVGRNLVLAHRTSRSFVQLPNNSDQPPQKNAP